MQVLCQQLNFKKKVFPFGGCAALRRSFVKLANLLYCADVEYAIGDCQVHARKQKTPAGATVRIE